MKQKFFFLILAFLFMGTNLFAVDYYVNYSTGDDGNAGTSSGAAFKTLSQAVFSALDGDKIIIVGTVNQDTEIVLNKAITFEGTSNAVIVGDTNRLFNVVGMSDASSISFSSINFKNFVSTAQGAVLNHSSDTVITFNFTNCNFLNNSTSNINGGGVFYFGESPTVNITGCTFYNNAVTGTGQNARGGAINFFGSSKATITNSTFHLNKVAKSGNFHGAAIRVNSESCEISVSNSLFYDNKSGNNLNSDFNGVPNAKMYFTNSLAQYTNNVDDPDSNNGSDMAADFTNTEFEFESPNLTYTAPTSISDATPIDFGSDNSDAGAWDSNINLFETGSDWATATNWSSAAIPLATDNVTLLSDSPDLVVDATTGAVANKLSVNASSSLTINSGGSLIVNESSSGNVTYKRTLTYVLGNTNGWHLIASPLAGQTYDNTYATTNGLATSGGTKRGLAYYNDALASGSKYTYLLSNDGNITDFNSGTYSGSGVGYSAKRENNSGAVAFTGTVNTDNVDGVNVSTAGNGFNLLGVPYTSYISSQTFLTENANLDQTQIWVWKQDDTTGGNFITLTAKADNFILAPGQGFFVKATSGTTVNFSESNQTGNADTFQKSSRTEIKLLMSDGENNRFAKFYYPDNVTKGFDAGWEGEVFGGIPNSLDVFSQLVENNQGKKYQVQSLPISEIDNMVIPIGVKAASGKEITFTAEAMNLPNGINVFLEDRITDTVTLLNEVNASYKVTLNEDTNDVGRFYLHTTSNQVLSTTGGLLENISIYATKNKTLRMIGLPTGSSSVKLFNILGKQVMQSRFISTGIKEISLPKLTTGVYFVRIDSEAGKLNKKIVIE